MRFSPSGRRKSARFNMTPMIDVVLQLIIFFMYTSQFAMLARTPIDLPEEKGDESDAPEKGAVVVDVLSDGSYLVETQAIDLNGLSELVRVEIQLAGGDTDEVRVLVRPDRNVPAASVNALALRLSEMGVSNWAIGTAEPRGGG